MCRRVFNKTIILLGLAGHEMIITNSALRASLVIYHFLLKTELRILDFQHFHWLAGHRLSAHIPALPIWSMKASIKKAG